MSPLQFLMLLQLKKDPKYGYEMLKVLRVHFSGVWEPKTGTIYPALRRLEARGFVNTETKEEMEFYKLTEQGESLLNQIGERLESDFKFADRYFRLITELMPRAMKYSMLKMMRTLAEEDVRPPIFIEHFLDEEMDSTTKLEALKSIRKHIEIRLEAVDGMIEDLNDGGTS